MSEAERLRGLISDYKAVFGTEAGVSVLRDLMRHFGYTRTSTLVEGDPIASARNEGQRTVLIRIGKLIDADPTAVEDDGMLMEKDDENPVAF